MLELNYIKPSYTQVTNNTLHLFFAYQYLSITSNGELFHFIPIEGKEINVDLRSMQVVNTNEILVFQKGNSFIRLPIYQLMLFPNINEKLGAIVNDSILQHKLSGIHQQQYTPSINDKTVGLNNVEHHKVLMSEVDYELGSLFTAMNDNDTSEIDRSKKRLAEIRNEIEEMGMTIS